MRGNVHWWHGILARSLMAVVGIALLMGGVSSLLVNQVVGERAHRLALLKLGELLDTVESTVSIAAFVGDEQLATEVAHGLLRNGEVLQVTIRGNERELVRAERAPLRVVNGDALLLMTGPLPKVGAGETALPAVKRLLYSPFKAGEVIGEIRLDADQGAITARVAGATRFISLLLAGQLILVIAAAAVAMLYLVVRPLKATSDRLHRLDAASGERLAVPESHAKSELGRLVGDINNLTARLVATIGIESDLLRQQVIDQRKYQDLFDKAAAGIFVADRDGRLESFNRTFAALTWLQRRKESTGRWLADAGWQAPERLLALLRDALADPTGKATRADDFLLVGRRGDERWLHVAVTPLGDGNVQGTLTDVTERRNEEISTRRLATTDALTGFANRAGLQHALAEITPHTPPFALVMLDLDGFKRINDALGFAVGDQLLMGVAGRIRKLLDARDQVARVGGDEFALALVGEQSRVALAARIGQLLRVLAEPYDVSVAGKHEQIDIAASADIAFFPPMATTCRSCCAAPSWRSTACRRPAAAVSATSSPPSNWRSSIGGALKTTCVMRWTPANCIWFFSRLLI